MPRQSRINTTIKVSKEKVETFRHIHVPTHFETYAYIGSSGTSTTTTTTTVLQSCLLYKNFTIIDKPIDHLPIHLIVALRLV